MRKVGACGLAATLVVGLAAPTALAGDDAARGDDAKPAAKASSSWWNPATWFGTKEKKPAEKKATSKTANHTSKKSIAPAKTPTLVDEAAAERGREEALLLRRLQVCDKLTDIAVRTNDNHLLRRAEELDERARTAYAQHTAYLRSGSFSDVDEQILERHLRSNTAATTHLLEGSSRKTDAKARDDRAAVKEVNQ